MREAQQRQDAGGHGGGQVESGNTWQMRSTDGADQNTLHGKLGLPPGVQGECSSSILSQERFFIPLFSPIPYTTTGS